MKDDKKKKYDVMKEYRSQMNRPGVKEGIKKYFQKRYDEGLEKFIDSSKFKVGEFLRLVSVLFLCGWFIIGYDIFGTAAI